MASQRSGRLTLPIDVRFRGVGRLHVRSGTRKKSERNAMRDMLRTLYSMGRSDLLRDIKANRVTVLEVWERYRFGNLAQLPRGDMMRSLKAAWTDWLEGKEIARKTRRDYELARDRLLAFEPDAPLSRLPELARAHRKASMGTHPRTFNKDRAAALSMLADLFDDDHWLYREVRRQKTLKIPESVKLGYSPQTVEQIRGLAAGFRAKGQPHHALTLWGLCLTGMRPEEFFEEDGNTWTLEAELVRIDGAKTKAAKRVCPRISQPLKPSTSRGAFTKALRKLTSGEVAPYDCRRSYSQWCEEAGLPESRFKFYFGHGPTNPTELYKRRKECLPHIRQDTARLMTLFSEGVPTDVTTV